jgi:hypothetical protein
MKVNHSLGVRRKLPLKKAAAATAIDLFAAVTFTVAESIQSAAVCAARTVLAQVLKYGQDFATTSWLSAGKAVA